MNGTGTVVAVALGGLAGSYLLGDDKSLATLPVSSVGVGLAVGAVPAAMFTQRVGRRLGLMSGTGFAMSGGLIAAGALALGSFWLFTLAFFLIGLSSAFVQQYRFAAAEGAPPPISAAQQYRV